jgi:ATP-dependent helicase HepA
VEEIAERTYRLGSAGILRDSFPGLPSEGFTVTCDRERALVREDVQFLTWDHPLVTGALDLLLGSEKGNCSISEEKDKTGAPRLEAVYVLECVAPQQLQVDRFLPPTPIRVVVDGEDLETMLAQAQELADNNVPAIVKSARQDMAGQLNTEITRLKELKKVNPSVRKQEIDLLVDQQRGLEEHLSNARLRLDAIRVSVPAS